MFMWMFCCHVVHCFPFHCCCFFQNLFFVIVSWRNSLVLFYINSYHQVLNKCFPGRMNIVALFCDFSMPEAAGQASSLHYGNHWFTHETYRTMNATNIKKIIIKNRRKNVCFFQLHRERTQWGDGMTFHSLKSGMENIFNISIPKGRTWSLF